MQQTQNLKLNLIETDDPLSPTPLNENMDKVEAALGAQNTRIVNLENCRIVTGTYWGNGVRTGQNIDLGGRPLAGVIRTGAIEKGVTAAISGDARGTNSFIITDNGFLVASIANYNKRYSFFAIIGNWAELHIHEPYIGQ